MNLVTPRYLRDASPDGILCRTCAATENGRGTRRGAVFLATDHNRRRPTKLRKPLACDRHPTYPDARSAFQSKHSQLSRDSRLTDEGSDRLRVPVVPRSPALESSLCTEQSMPVEVWGWPRLEREPQLGAGKSQAAHTTTSPPLLADPSRPSRSLAKRRQVSPFVRLIKWMSVIDLIPRVDLGCSMPGHQRAESFVQKSCVIQTRPQPPRSV